MAVNIAVAQHSFDDFATTVDITKAGFGSNGKAAMDILNRSTSFGTIRGGGQIAVGFTDGTTDRSCGINATDNQGNTNTDRMVRNDSTILQLKRSDGTLLGSAAHTSWITDGERVTWTGGEERGLGTTVLFGGTDVSAKVGTFNSATADDTESTISGIGFEPDVVIFAMINEGTFNTVKVTSFLSIGFAANDGVSGVQGQGHQSIFDRNNVGTSDLGSLSRNNRIAQQHTTGLGTSLECTGFTSDAFKVTTRDYGAQLKNVMYLALNFNGKVSFGVENIDSPVATGDHDITAFGFQPQFVMQLMNFCAAYGTIETDGDGGSNAISTFTEADEHALTYMSEDAVGTSNTACVIDNAAGNMLRDDQTGGYDSSASSMLSNGYRVNYSAVDGTTRKWNALAIGIEAPTDIFAGDHSVGRGVGRGVGVGVG